MRWLKSVTLVLFLAAIVVGSFWISFLLGKQMLMPVKKIPLKGEEAFNQGSEKINLLSKPISFEVVMEGEEPLIPVDEVKKEPKKVEAAAPKKKAVTFKKPSAKPAYSVQVGAFSSYANALELKAELSGEGYPSSVQKSGKMWKVKIGPYYSYGDAKDAAEILKEAGFGIVIRRER